MAKEAFLDAARLSILSAFAGAAVAWYNSDPIVSEALRYSGNAFATMAPVGLIGSFFVSSDDSEHSREGKVLVPTVLAGLLTFTAATLEDDMQLYNPSWWGNQMLSTAHIAPQ